MKALSFVSSFVLFLMVTATSANADVLDPTHPHPHPRPGIVAEVQTSGGFAPGAIYEGVRIYADGTVLSFHLREQHVVAQLSNEALEDLKREIAMIPANAKMVDLNPRAPHCVDAPSTTYSVYPGADYARAIAQRADCHDYQLNAGNIYRLKSILDGLNSLGQN